MLSSLPLYHTGREAPVPDARSGKKQAEGRHAGRRGVAPPLNLRSSLQQGPLS